MIKDEKGYALLYALLTTIIVSALVFGVFVKAMQVNNQVEKLSEMDGKIDTGELAIQEAKSKLGKTLKNKILVDDEAIVNLGVDETIFKKKALEAKDEVNALGNDFSDLGNTREKLTYSIQVGNPDITKRTKRLRTSENQNNWRELTESESQKLEIYGYNADFPIFIEVKDDKGNIKKISCTFSYVLQWQTYADGAGEIIARAEMWGSNHNDPNLTTAGVETKYPRIINQMNVLLSTSDIVKKTAFHADTNKILSAYPSGETISNQLFDQKGEFLVDYYDKTGVIDWGKEHKVGNNNIAKGSMVFEKGVQLFGDDRAVPESGIDIHNMLKLSNVDRNGIKYNYLKDVNLNVGYGIILRINPQNSEVKVDGSGTPVDFDNDGMVEMVKKDSRLVIDNDTDRYKITTPNLLILNCINNLEDDDTRVDFGQGKIHITQLPFLAAINTYSNFSIQKTKAIPTDYYKLAQSENSSFIIANSRVNLTPTSYSINGKSYSTKDDDIRKIVVDGNFNLTNLAGKVYFENILNSEYTYGVNDEIGANKETILNMSGKNTSLEVKGFSHIDCPKREARPPILNQVSEEEFKRFDIDTPGKYPDSNISKLVKVNLKNKCQIKLGYTSVEPFKLNMEDDTVFRMKVLPHNLRFDPYFIKNWNKKGKIILEVGQNNDVTKMKKILKDVGITSTVVTTSSENFDDDSATNGNVTIVLTNDAEAPTIQGINNMGGKVKDISYN